MPPFAKHLFYPKLQRFHRDRDTLQFFLDAHKVVDLILRDGPVGGDLDEPLIFCGPSR